MIVGYVPVSSELGLESARVREEKIRSELKPIIDFEYALVSDEREAKKLAEDIRNKNIDTLIIPVLTGGTEDKIIALSESNSHLVLLTTMYYNSFPAALEAASRLKAEGKRFSIIDLDRFKIDKVMRVIELLKRLSRDKLVMFGDPSPWLVYSLPNEEAIASKLGLKIEKVGLRDLIDGYKNSEASPDVLAYESSRRTNEVIEGEFERVGRIHTAIQKMLLERNSVFFTIRCFDLIKELGTTPCLSVAIFNDRGITATCEGDVPAAISMRIGQLLSEKPTFIANTLKVEGRKILLAHCTIAPSLTENYTLRTHFESNKGIGVQGELREGEEVTLIKFTPDMDKIYYAKGKITNGKPFSDDLCRTQVEIELEKEPVRILKDPPGNHLVVVFKDVREELSVLSQLINSQLIEL